eukprot:TRINITY_DN13078_c0_g1_i1.p1 TRINITY_DN13078_c0_g1~~TRINITY_DN13078_c0_g1_i1.p1  ORF type:complete len:102 (+),score=32.17 TRINITY_DN13078_c0_g1_i1:35-340(+)
MLFFLSTRRTQIVTQRRSSAASDVYKRQDVVRSNIEKIGGTIDMVSIEGKGSTFQIKIPLTLAIVAGLIVKAQDERYAIPQIRELEPVYYTNLTLPTIYSV